MKFGVNSILQKILHSCIDSKTWLCQQGGLYIFLCWDLKLISCFCAYDVIIDHAV